MEKKYLTISEVCEITGLSRQTIYSEIYKSKIMGKGLKFIKFGPKSLRFDRDHIIEWMENRYESFTPMSVALAKRGTNRETKVMKSLTNN